MNNTVELIQNLIVQYKRENLDEEFIILIDVNTLINMGDLVEDTSITEDRLLGYKVVTTHTMTTKPLVSLIPKSLLFAYTRDLHQDMIRSVMDRLKPGVIF